MQPFEEKGEQAGEYDGRGTQSSAIAFSSTRGSDTYFRRRHQPRWLQRTDKYWLELPKSKGQKWARYIVLCGISIGLLLMFGIVVIEYLRSNRAKYLLVLHDKFSGSELSADLWQHEQELGGYNEGSFDQTTDGIANSWVSNEMLHIKPTVVPIYADQQTLDLQSSGVCTSTKRSDCYALQNATGYSAIPNIQTARLKSKVSIKYGKVEVVAKLPIGDWIFSTIGLDPAELVYGNFPASGQIEVAQSRGNRNSYVSGGRNKIDSIVHFGSDGHAYADCADMTRNRVKLTRTDFASGFHTFGLEWTPKSIRTWLDYPSNTMLEVRWPQGFWRKAAYAKRYQNDVNFEHLTNPWTNGTLAAPYDQAFHLTLRSNVGSVNGIFGVSPGKPWYDDAGRGASMLTFQNNQTWLESWGSEEDHTMYIKEVKMWQQIM